jgi:cyclopropane-fatty-acyl-phospholipid synthase
MWESLVDRMLGHMIRHGTIEVTLPSGRVVRKGEDGAAPVRVKLADPAIPRRIFAAPDLAMGEAYMDGTLTVENDDLRGLLRLITANMGGPTFWALRPRDWLRTATKRLVQYSPIGKAQKNVAHHYDLSAELYALFLDADRQYSCAYFRRPTDTLERAQAQKKAHIAKKLLIEPGMRVLDIGCGWGGMALTLARDHGARVVGVTLSTEQHAIATARAREAGLDERVEFRLQDYREVPESFDRVVSVGMFEHVGVPHYREYFRHVRQRLTPEGVALIHTIGRPTPPAYTGKFIDRYIFPGGYTPAMSEVVTAVEKEDLVACDVEIWRLHYAETLKHWYDRFMANIDRVREIYDERFCRMWRFYLVSCEMSFRAGLQDVFQFQLARRQDAVPLTRDYLHAEPEAPAKTRSRARAAAR